MRILEAAAKHNVAEVTVPKKGTLRVYYLSSLIVVFLVKLKYADGRELDVSSYLCPADSPKFSVCETEV